MIDPRNDCIPGPPSFVIEPDGDNLFSVTAVHEDGHRELVVSGYRMFDAQRAKESAETYQRRKLAQSVKEREAARTAAARGGNDA